MMWRPWCLAQLSKHAKNTMSKSPERWQRNELEIDRAFVARHKALVKMNVSVLVVSYADLLWRQDRTVMRVQEFLPCAGRLSTSFVPQPGVDYFEANHIKVQGSIREFGHSASAERLGYNRSSHTCTVPPGDALPPHEQHGARAHMWYLRRHS